VIGVGVGEGSRRLIVGRRRRRDRESFIDIDRLPETPCSELNAPSSKM